MKAKIAELEAIIKASQEQEPVGLFTPYDDDAGKICYIEANKFEIDNGLAKPLYAANQRNKELQSENETCRNLMRIKQEQNDAFSQRIEELNKRIAELENKV